MARELKKLIVFAGGFDWVVRFHLLAALPMAALVMYHLASVVFLAVKEDWTLHDLTLFPNRKDFEDLIRNAKYLLFLDADKPKLGKYGFIQKFDYFVALLGIGFMLASGLALGFPERLASLIHPDRLADLRSIHLCAGYLLVFVFLAWHAHNNLLAPDKFLSNWSWINGKMSEGMMKREHAGYYEEIIQREREEQLVKEKAAEKRSMETTIRKEARRLQEYLEAGNQFAKEAEYDKAIEQYEKALKLLPNFPKAQYNLATVRHKAGDLRQAVVEYRKFIEMDPFNLLAEKAKTTLSEIEKSLDGEGADGDR